MGLKKTHPHLKVSLAIGGGKVESASFSKIASDPLRRSSFVKSALQFLLKYGFDGLDLDWEYPTQEGGKPEDRENFTQLVKELRSAFRKHNLLLTAALGASAALIDEAYNVEVLSENLDFMHVMTYDYHGSWDKRVGPNAPLRSADRLNVEHSIAHLIKLGADPGKLVLGLPFYGRTFLAEGDGELNGPADEIGFQGPYTKANGFMDYNEVCSEIRKGDWKLSWDSEAAQAYARQRVSDQLKTRVIVFDSPRSIANKVRFGVDKELGGFMVWSLDTDDFLGGGTALDRDTFVDFKWVKVRLGDESFPLLRAVNKTITTIGLYNSAVVEEKISWLYVTAAVISTAVGVGFALFLP